MWKPEHRQAGNRNGLRYPSDLTDAEWVIVAPMIRLDAVAGEMSVTVREVLNGIFYILWTGCQWKAAKRPAAEEHVHDYLELWNWDGTLDASTMHSTSRYASRPDVAQSDGSDY